MKKAQVIQEGTIGDRLLDMFEQSVIIQSLVTFLLILSCCVIWIWGTTSGKGADVPQDLVNLTLLVVGFWFGQKTSVNTQQAVRKMTSHLAEAVVTVADTEIGGQEDGTGEVGTGVDC